MVNKIIMEGITFDDVLLLPGYTDFKRESVDLTTVLHPTLVLPLPVLSSPMDTVTEENMAISIARAGGLGIIHRNLSVDDQASMVARVKKHSLSVGAAVSMGKDVFIRVAALMKARANVIVVDSGQGNSKFVVDAVVAIKNKYPGSVVMAGNVATVDGAKRLVRAGADILRVGMGPGSICTTRVVTGMGMPQLSAIAQAVTAVGNSRVTVVADGGIRQIGDMAKALGIGAHAVMVGSLLAGFDESPGEKIIADKKTYKYYRGMGSVAAMKNGSAERYGQSRDTGGKQLIAEGVEGLVAYKGGVKGYFDQIAGSLRSSFYYIGARNIADFHKKARFVRITSASMTESHPHSIMVTSAGGNYEV